MNWRKRDEPRVERGELGGAKLQRRCGGEREEKGTRILPKAYLTIHVVLVSLVGLVFIYLLVPETKGLQFEEIEKLLQKVFRPKLFASKDEETKETKTVES